MTNLEKINIQKELYIGRELFINTNQNSFKIEEISTQNNKIRISIGLDYSLYYYPDTNIFKLDSYHGSNEVLISFDASSHRAKYLKKKIEELKSSNEEMDKKIVKNWNLIHEYQTKLMGL